MQSHLIPPHEDIPQPQTIRQDKLALSVIAAGAILFCAAIGMLILLSRT